jgi:hypothetical protein
MEDPTLGSWYVGNKIMSRKSVVFVRNPSVQPRLVNYCGWLKQELLCAASLRCNSKRCLVILKTM